MTQLIGACNVAVREVVLYTGTTPPALVSQDVAIAVVGNRAFFVAALSGAWPVVVVMFQFVSAVASGK